MLKIPDVDLLEQMYEGATVRLAPNDEKSATITFNTGVAQGIITSQQLFNIFINALLRMHTVTGQIRREQQPAPLLIINGETLQAMNLDDACRYLGYWGTGNGDMRATKKWSGKRSLKHVT